MKICVISPSALRTPPENDMYAGIERQCWLEVVGLSELGHSVSLIARGDSAIPPNGKLYALPNEEHVSDIADEVIRDMGEGVIFIDETHNKLLTVHRPEYKQITRYEVMSLMGKPSCPVLTSEGQCREKFNGVNWPILHQMVDLEVFPLYDGPRENYLAYVGQKITEKRIEWACETAVRTNTPLYIHGPGWGQQDCHDRINAYAEKYPDLIHNLWEVGGEEKLNLLQHAKALIHLPGALGWSEAGAIVVLEALACGTPVIGSRNGCIPEYIAGKNNGFICDTIEDAVASVDKVADIKPIDCRNSVLDFDYRRIALQWQDLCARVSNGERW